MFDDEFSNPVISNPGAYHTMCIELNITHLASNTMLQSQFIQDLEMAAGGDAAAGDLAVEDRSTLEDIKRNYTKKFYRNDESNACFKAFRILKQLVNNWCRDIGCEASSKYADPLLTYFYHWLRSPSSKFHDPYLHKMVHRLMSKVLHQLVERFKMLGSNIIYASFDRIIIETNRNGIQHMNAYVESCLKSIKKKDLFRWIVLEPSNCWECLLWLDHANYGGYLLLPNEDAEHMNILATNDYHRELESQWNLASFLPPFAEDRFEIIIGKYLQLSRNTYNKMLISDVDVEDKKLYSLQSQPQPQSPKSKRLLIRNKGKREMIDSDDDFDINVESEEEKEEMANNNNSNAPFIPLAPAELKRKFARYKNKMINNDLARKILEYVHHIRRELRSDTSQRNVRAEVFPVRPGSHLPLQIPSLEFIKDVCFVLGLDSDIKDPTISDLKEDMLRLIEVSYYSPLAKFLNPCQTYILPDVKCAQCQSYRDIDLCRDSFTKPKAIWKSNHDDDVWYFECFECRSLIDKDLVETMLLDIVKKRETAYHVQDLLCIECGLPQVLVMLENCKCGGEYRLEQNCEQFESNITVFHTIAKLFDMHFLLDTMEWILFHR